MSLIKSRNFFLLITLIFFQVVIYSNPVNTSNHVYEEIYIEASRYKFDFHYENGTMTSNYVELFIDLTYTLTVTSLDVPHVLSISTPPVSVDIPAQLGVNNSADVTFTDIFGFDATCGQLCGNAQSHSSMSARFEVLQGNIILLNFTSTTTETVSIGNDPYNITESVYFPTTIDQNNDATTTTTESIVNEETIVITETAPFLYLNSFLIFLITVKIIHKHLFRELKMK